MVFARFGIHPREPREWKDRHEKRRKARRRWTLCSVNAASWTSSLPFAASNAFDVYCVQEVCRSGEWVQIAEVQAQYAGLQACLNASRITDKEGLSSGVAIVSPENHAISDVGLSAGVVDSRPPPEHFMIRSWRGLTPLGIPTPTIYCETGGNPCRPTRGCYDRLVEYCEL